ncbi:MAG TPA: YraN family protein [Candidatus Gracilibacteria bacterium]
MPSPNQQLGLEGQRVAQYFLEKKGYQVLTQNYAAQGGEIDLIAWDVTQNCFALVEVKTRRSLDFGYAEESITRNKVRFMNRAAARYFFKELKLPALPDYEIHAITVFKKEGSYKISHFKNVGIEWQ